MHTDHLTLFKEKIAVDKNFSFTTIQEKGKRRFRFDLEETYDEPISDILDAILFLNKKFYDNPLSDSEFDMEDYARFTGRKLKKVHGLTGPKSQHYDNDLERLFYKFVNRNMVINDCFYSPNGEIKEVYEPFPILQKYYKISKKELLSKGFDKRKKRYAAKLNPIIIENLSTFLFYTTLSDYQKIVNEYYRNRRNRLLYSRLSNLLNNLKGQQSDKTSFEELKFIMNYKSKDHREVKRLLTDAIDTMLKLESLQGLNFKWQPNRRGHVYIPHFWIDESVKSNLLNESRVDKFKRLDLLIMSKLSQSVTVENDRISYEELREYLDRYVFDILHYCFPKVLKKESKSEDYSLFLDHLCYKDDYGNLYASHCLKYVTVNEQPLVGDSFYQNNKKLSYLY